jgi:hypothetical protein
LNFINDRELARRFKSQAVSSRERLVYFCILMLVSVSASTPSLWAFFLTDDSGALIDLNRWDAYLDFSTVALAPLGVIYCYLQNWHGDDREFIERWVCIGFPVGIQMLLLLFIAIVVTLVPADLIFGMEISDATNVWGVGVTLAAEFYFFARLGSSIRIAAN